jgi:hypothetical protein
MLAYTRCMREHGVNLQVSTDGSGGITSTVGGDAVALADPAGSAAPAQVPAGGTTGQDPMKDADAACRSLLPASGQADPNATPDPAQMEQMLAFSKCMRDHGVDYPDPKFDGGAISIQIGGPGSNLDPSSQAFQDAQKTCGSTLPGGGPITIGGSGTTSVGISVGNGNGTGTNP